MIYNSTKITWLNESLKMAGFIKTNPFYKVSLAAMKSMVYFAHKLERKHEKGT